MREQPHYTNLLTEDFFIEMYMQKELSFPKIRELLLKQGHNISVGTIYKYAKNFGIRRNASEARRNMLGDNCLDYNTSFITESVIEHLDGFLLGDGSLSKQDHRSASHVGRASCGVEHEEFCRYLISGFKHYKPICKPYKDKAMKQGFQWVGRTHFHPDLYHQHLRWYPAVQEGKRIKQPPDDVRITPKSVMFWYLGDGSVVVKEKSIMLRLSTDGFDPERVEFLAKKLRAIGIQCHRNNDNRIQLKAKGIPAFFDFIGRESPIDCYNYKFNLPEWRFEAKRMRQVSEELGVEYQRLAYLVKIGMLSCYRISKNGRPRFLPEHINEAKKLKVIGELY